MNDSTKILELVCAFCGAPMYICQEVSSGSGYFFGECLNGDCGIATPYQDTEKKIRDIITKRSYEKQ